MKVTNAADAKRLVEQLFASSIAIQTRDLRLAVENLELDQMYYEQKGNDQGVQRCEVCLDILRHRLAALS